jgi:GDP-4-dehydro-6-deoxy-D-mannose reductase
MKRYLITGCNGFVAYHFMEYLDSLNEKVQVLGLDITVINLQNYKFSNIEFRCIKLNLIDFDNLEIAIVSFSPTYILHLASFSSVGDSWKKPIDSFLNNTNIFLNLIEIVKKNNIKCRILSIGSSEEYGNIQKSNLPLKETNELNPISPYAVARVSQEMLSRCYVLSYKIEIILTRSFNHIGPRQRDTFAIPSFVKQMVECKLKGMKNVTLYTGDISIIRDFLDVRDVVRAYYELLEKGIPGELYNICTGVGYSLGDIIAMIADLIDVSVNIIADPEKIRPNDNQIIIGDNSKIKKAIGWSPNFTLKDSLRDLISYWKNELGVHKNIKEIENIK